MSYIEDGFNKQLNSSFNINNTKFFDTKRMPLSQKVSLESCDVLDLSSSHKTETFIDKLFKSKKQEELGVVPSSKCSKGSISFKGATRVISDSEKINFITSQLSTDMKKSNKFLKILEKELFVGTIVADENLKFNQKIFSQLKNYDVKLASYSAIYNVKDIKSVVELSKQCLSAKKAALISSNPKKLKMFYQMRKEGFTPILSSNYNRSLQYFKLKEIDEQLAKSFISSGVSDFDFIQNEYSSLKELGFDSNLIVDLSLPEFKEKYLSVSPKNKEVAVYSVLYDLKNPNEAIEIYCKTGDANRAAFEACLKTQFDEKTTSEILESFDLNRDNFDCYDWRLILLEMKESEYFSPTEYIDAFSYFKNLKDKDGNRLITNNSLISSFLKINPSSVLSSNLESLIYLVQEGVCPSQVLNNIASQDLNNYILSDIQILDDVIVNNTDKSKLKQELIDSYIPEFTSESVALSQCKIGDAFKLEDEAFIRLKVSDNESELMKLSKETYNELFPLLTRFSSSQANLDNCYLVEPTMLMYQKPSFRADFVRMFSEKDGNIEIKLPTLEKPIIFKNGTLPESQVSGSFSKGAKGFELLQYAYAQKLKDEIIEKVKSSLIENDEELANFNRFCEENGDNIFIRLFLDKFSYKTFDEAIKDGDIYLSNDCADGFDVISNLNCTSFNSYLVNLGGQLDSALNTFGYDTDCCVVALDDSDSKKEAAREKFYKLKEAMQEEEFFENNIVLVGLNRHAYALEASKDDKGTMIYSLYNPLSQSYITAQDENLVELLSSVGVFESFCVASKKKN